MLYTGGGVLVHVAVYDSKPEEEEKVFCQKASDGRAAEAQKVSANVLS